MLIYGKNILTETNKKTIRKAYISRNDYIDYLKENKIKYEVVNHKLLDKMVKGNHQGIVLEIDNYDYYNINEVSSDFVVILDHLEDPHNFGSIIRTCACAGIKEIIIPQDRAVRVNDTVVKVSAGMIHQVKIILVVNLVNAINKLKDKGYFIYASDMKGKEYKTIDYANKKVLIIGNEGKGISRLVKENADEIISISMNNNTESLNASVAAGILIFEMR